MYKIKRRKGDKKYKKMNKRITPSQGRQNEIKKKNTAMSKTLEPPLSFYFASKEGLSEGLLFHAFSAQFSYLTIFR